MEYKYAMRVTAISCGAAVSLSVFVPSLPRLVTFSPACAEKVSHCSYCKVLHPLGAHRHSVSCPWWHTWRGGKLVGGAAIHRSSSTTHQSCIQGKRAVRGEGHFELDYPQLVLLNANYANNRWWRVGGTATVLFSVEASGSFHAPNHELGHTKSARYMEGWHKSDLRQEKFEDAKALSSKGLATIG